MSLFCPDPKDPLKIRRFMAGATALYALVIWPNLLIAYNLLFGLPESMVDKMLVYIGTLAAGPIGVYLWATLRKSKTEPD